MNDKVNKYLSLLSIWKITDQTLPESNGLCDELDVLWYSFSEDEIEYIEQNADSYIKINS